MIHDTKHAPRRAALPAATLAALLLAGCSSGNIGESWQCPLAEGGSCDSVAAADPAVPDAGGTALGEPLWRVRGDELPEVRAETRCATECDGGFDPFAWLARLFAAEVREGDSGPAGGWAQTPSATVARSSDPVSGGDADAPAEPTAALPGPGSRPGQAPDPAIGEPDAGDLRTGEIVARIWIAPFVDADGVYREASHVRVVLEPAGWRLP